MHCRTYQSISGQVRLTRETGITVQNNHGLFGNLLANRSKDGDCGIQIHSDTPRVPTTAAHESPVLTR